MLHIQRKGEPGRRMELMYPHNVVVALKKKSAAEAIPRLLLLHHACVCVHHQKVPAQQEHELQRQTLH